MVLHNGINVNVIRVSLHNKIFSSTGLQYSDKYYNDVLILLLNYVKFSLNMYSPYDELMKYVLTGVSILVYKYLCC